MKALPILVLPFLALPATAQSLVPGPNQPGRYEMQPVPGGVARLDTVTGDVSLCRMEDGALRCRPSEDDDAAAGPAPGDRRSDLSGNDEEEDRGPADHDRADRDTGPRAERHSDNDADLDKAIRRMKKLFHAFGDIARDWDGEQKRGGPDESNPDRT